MVISGYADDVMTLVICDGADGDSDNAGIIIILIFVFFLIFEARVWVVVLRGVIGWVLRAEFTLLVLGVE